MQIRMAGVTHVGRRRKSNQDSLFFDEGHGIGVVADGIGGRRGGDIASTLVVEGIRDVFMSAEMIIHDEVVTFLTSAVDKVNSSVFGYGIANPDYAGLGSTMECIFFSGDNVYIAHVGDSRTYLYQDGSLFQLTIDHNVQNFVERGLVPRESLNDPSVRGAALVKAVGLQNRCEIDVCQIRRRPGQVYLSCSDGLTSMIPDQSVVKILDKYGSDLDVAATKLQDAANEAGGKDNITVLLAKVEGRQ